MKKNLPFILLTAILLMIETRPLVMQGMFFDGMLYASIAWNMAHHIGTFWSPAVNPLFFPQFFEHPPLGMILQSSLFYLIHSNSIYIDKLYCFVIAILNMTAVYLIWRITTPNIEKSFFWIPILIWLLLFDNFTDIQSGFLETTLTVFTSFASLCILQWMMTSDTDHHWITQFKAIIPSVLISCAFLVNGLQAFFPLSIPFIYGYVFQTSKLRALKQTFLLTISTAIFLTIVFLYPPAYQNVQHYFHLQVFPSFFGPRVGNFLGWKHFSGILFLIRSCIYLIGLTLIFWLIYAKKNRYPVHKKWMLFFLLTTFAASLPILLSSRQTGHYFYQAFPFLVLLFAHLLTPFLQQWVREIDVHQRRFRWIVGLLIVGMAIESFVLMQSVGKIGRDKPIVADVLQVQRVLPEGTVLSVSENLMTNWPLVIYLYRYHRISLTPESGQQYYLQPKSLKDQPAGYHLQNTPLQFYSLFEKNPI